MLQCCKVLKLQFSNSAMLLYCHIVFHVVILQCRNTVILSFMLYHLIILPKLCVLCTVHQDVIWGCERRTLQFDWILILIYVILILMWILILILIIIYMILMWRGKRNIHFSLRLTLKVLCVVSNNSCLHFSKSSFLILGILYWMSIYLGKDNSAALRLNNRKNKTTVGRKYCLLLAFHWIISELWHHF